MQNKKFDLRKRNKKVVCLKEELEDFMNYFGLDDRMDELKILSVWKDCVGEKISQFSKPIGLKDHKLLISVENSVWRYELAARKQDILEKLNSSLQKKEIKEIVFI